ncbi:MAG TPA: TlpA disulfide reductase family protein [Candidatus Saccharimonadales bacterium]|nr:TlpA disulfide reductase family protein [Candidatus Saccharimonadales bacterium]
MLAVSRPLRSFPALLLSVALLVAGCSSSGTAKVGDPAPEISGTTLDGQPLTLSSLRGRPVVVNFWASWCVPCRAEFPVLKDELAKHAADGLEIIGVVYKDSAGPARQFVTSFGATWPSVIDPTGSIATAYRVVAPPQSYFIDRQGILRSIQIGQIETQDFDQQYPAISK